MPKKKSKPAEKPRSASDFFGDGMSDCVKRWNRLTGSQRMAIDLSGFDFTNRNLSGVNLNQVRASGVLFSKSNLSDSRLQGWFSRCSFAEANLSRATMKSGHFEHSDFSFSNLTATDFSKANLENANLSGSHLNNAVLKEAQLSGVDLTDATLTNVNWIGAAFDKNTKWPMGFVVPGELRWQGTSTDPRLSGRGAMAVASDINGLMARLHKLIDSRRMARVLDMLKKEKHQLYAEVSATFVRGIVESHTEEGLVYSCALTDKGIYSCSTPELSKCFGLHDEPCKHLLVLIIGLARAGLLDPTVADNWMVAASKRGPSASKLVKNHLSDSLLKYKGVEAGEVDWRPTETIPEDFYTL